MEFFYLDNWFAYTGGYVMYYMGIYAYASDVSSVKNRALRSAKISKHSYVSRVEEKTLAQGRSLEFLLAFFAINRIQGDSLLFRYEIGVVI